MVQMLGFILGAYGATFMCSRHILLTQRELEIRNCFLLLSLQLHTILIRAINDFVDHEVNKDWGSGKDSQHAEQLCSSQLYSTSEMHVARNKFESTQI